MQTQTSPAPALELSIFCGRYSSLAYLKNGRPILWSLTLKASQTLRDLRIRASASPDFVRPLEWEIARLEAGKPYELQGKCPAYDETRLLQLKDETAGKLLVQVFDGKGALLAQKEDSFIWLAHNAWAGGFEYPELLAALALPSDPAINEILHPLQRDDGEWPGYAQDAPAIGNRLRELWDSVTALGISYARPPESWMDDGVGQRVRTPSQIMELRQSTCLDSTLLFAAATARMRLKPVPILIAGHAFLGVFLHARNLPAPVVKTPAAIRNFQRQGEMLVIETTAANEAADGLPIPFEAAKAAGEALLAGLGDDAFFLALDLDALWHECGIQPIVGGALPSSSQSAAMDEGSLVTRMPRTRMENWQLKLLDLSLRNNLLNTHLRGRNQLELLLPSVSKLEDDLDEGRAFRIRSVPQTYWTLTRQMQQGENSPQQAAMLRECVASMYGKRELASLLPDEELQKALQALYRSTRLEMEESGANTLYIACGFLKWRRSDSTRGAKAMLAPILLLPVQLTRPSVKAGFSLRGLGEEARINMTLLELLKTEFSLNIPELEGELPTDEAGLDVPRIFNIVRRAIEGYPDWEAVETCTLGSFSFTKYLMWKDMKDRADMLLHNPVVKQIAADERGLFPEQTGFPSPRTLDAEADTQKIFTPLSADSSQLSAILAAARGKDFVLIGPPGTGKSQTIANMIAHCLGHGKTVLFVAEKSAALGVVYKRLKRIGLADFCLELHSHKANKREALAQYRAAVEAVSAGEQADAWAESASSLASIKRLLNRLPEEMHRPQADGRSLYDELNLLAKSQGTPCFAPPLKSEPLACTREERQAMLDMAHELSLHFSPVAETLRLPAARDFDSCSMNLAEEEELAAALTRYAACAQGWDAAFSALAKALGLGENELRPCMPEWEPVLALAAGEHAAGAAALLPSRARAALEGLEAVHAHAAKYRELKDGLSLPYPETVTEEPELDAMLQECKLASISNFIIRWFKMGKISKWLRMQAMRRQKPDCLHDLQSLVAMRQELRALQSPEFAGLPREFANGAQTTDAQFDEAFRVARILQATAGEKEALAEHLLAQGASLLAPGTAAGKALRQLEERSREIRSLEQQLAARLGCACPGKYAPAAGAGDEWAAGLLVLRPQWRLLAIWNQKAAEAAQNGAAPLAEALKRGMVAPESLCDALEANLARVRLRAAAESSETLGSFTAQVHEARIADFADKDGKLLKEASDHVRQLLVRRAAAIGNHGKESAILQRELSKQRAHMPLRKLLSSIPNISALLKPCMLMSPLSAAQYLSEEMPLFDVVIFDEASQIPVWDAIGAIGRGKNAIIVGDPRQMPPTSFFSRSKNPDEADDAPEQDMESILDECRACGIPEMGLCWHYRSKAESLIAFSNLHYYDSKLTTFPAPVVTDKALESHYVGGIYEPGGSKRINRQEAQALVAHVLAALRQPGFKYTEASSIGIVTFNLQQQKLIEELLEEERSKDDSLEPFFSEENPEAIFVKNLENVQGDERGVIYFSTTYGPDSKGAFSMNFGPLNLHGGERRLNVAVTRARCGMHVFTSMKPEDIDLSRTQARGAADLKAFLDYARRGAAALKGSLHGGAGDAEDGLAMAIAAGLEARGWKCHTRIGVSDYRIDITVENPDQPDSTLAGILLDGESYAAACTARDRDILRPSVLRILGWRLLHVWGMEWWRNPQACLDELDSQLLKFRKQGAAAPAELPSLIPDGKPKRTEEAEPLQAEQTCALPMDPSPISGAEYREWSVAAPLPPLFEMSDASLRPVMCDFVAKEGPVILSYMLGRMVKASLSPHMTPTVKRRLEAIADQLVAKGDVLETQEEFNQGGEPARILRLPSTPAENPRSRGPRQWNDVPPSELRAISRLVQSNLKCIAGSDEHFRGIASYLGIGRMSRQFRDCLSFLLRPQHGDSPKA